MITVGLCGGSGSGKSTVAKMLSSFGIETIDTDEVYHGIVSYRSPCLLELVSEFGESIVASDGSLDRRALGAIVFKENGAPLIHRLNQITHKHVISATEKLLSVYENAGVPAVLIDAPLLFESGLDKRCDINVCVVAPLNVRIDRIVKRDGISREKAEKRIASQMSDGELLARCDYSLDTACSLDELRVRVGDLAKYILDYNL